MSDLIGIPCPCCRSTYVRFVSTKSDSHVNRLNVAYHCRECKHEGPSVEVDVGNPRVYRPLALKAWNEQ